MDKLVSLIKDKSYLIVCDSNASIKYLIKKFNKKLVNHKELRLTAVVSTKKTLKEINEFFKNISEIESIEIREYYE